MPHLLRPLSRTHGGAQWEPHSAALLEVSNDEGMANSRDRRPPGFKAAERMVYKKGQQ